MTSECWPSVTAVVPTLGDRPDLLEETLRSILDQDYPAPIECVVVLDRHSADLASPNITSDDRWERTRLVAEGLGARVLENKRKPGLAGSRNTGIVSADSILVANCDDDDYWLPGKLRAQVEALMTSASALMVCSGIELEYGTKIRERVHPGFVVTFKELLRSRIMALHVSTFLFKRSLVLNEVGLVSEEIPGSRSEDYEFLLRVARHTPVLNVPRPTVHVRWHKDRGAMYGRWPLVMQALPWLLTEYPEFRSVPSGYAKVAGQTAFAAAASGDRMTAWKWIKRSLSANPREIRAYIALGILSGIIRPNAVIRFLHEMGRGL